MIVRAIDNVKAILYKKGVQKRIVIGPNEGAPTFVMRVFDVSPGETTMYHSHDKVLSEKHGEAHYAFYVPDPVEWRGFSSRLVRLTPIHVLGYWVQINA